MPAQNGKADFQPGDHLLDRYLPNATEEVRENARAAFGRLGAILFGIQNRLAKEAAGHRRSYTAGMIDEVALLTHIKEVRRIHCTRLRADIARFPDAETLVRKFEEVAARTLTNLAGGTSELNCFINEMCVAHEIMQVLPDGYVLRYELPLANTQETVDFVTTRDGWVRHYIDVKTINPEWQTGETASARYERALGHVAQNINLVADGSTYHHMSAARSKFLDYALELERKISALAPDEAGHYAMIYCGNAFDWHLDELEDFTDFYRTGTHRSDDAFAAMEIHSLDQRGITLARTINQFGMVQRPTDWAERKEYRYGVRAPRLPGE